MTQTIYIIHKAPENPSLLRILKPTFTKLEEAQEWVENLVENQIYRLQDLDIAVGYKEGMS